MCRHQVLAIGLPELLRKRDRDEGGEPESDRRREENCRPKRQVASMQLVHPAGPGIFWTRKIVVFELHLLVCGTVDPQEVSIIVFIREPVQVVSL